MYLPLSEDNSTSPKKLARRDNWAAEEPGVVLVFAIVFIVGCGILAMIIQKELKRRREERAQWEVTEITDDKSDQN